MYDLIIYHTPWVWSFPHLDYEDHSTASTATYNINIQAYVHAYWCTQYLGVFYFVRLWVLARDTVRIFLGYQPSALALPSFEFNGFILFSRAHFISSSTFSCPLHYYFLAMRNIFFTLCETISFLATNNQTTSAFPAALTSLLLPLP